MTNLRSLEGEVAVEQTRDFNPFTMVMLNTEIPMNIQIPKLPLFDGSLDPNWHMKSFCAQMFLSGGID